MAIEVVKDFLTCKGCGANKWFLQTLLAEEWEAGRMPENARRGIVTQSEFTFPGQQRKAGDKITMAFVVEDFCMECGRRQTIRLEKDVGTVRLDVSRLLVPPPPGNREVRRHPPKN